MSNTMQNDAILEIILRMFTVHNGQTGFFGCIQQPPMLHFIPAKLDWQVIFIFICLLQKILH
mgnify:CR=1 FL=1